MHISLESLSEGQPFLIHQIHADKTLVKKLLGLGIRQGVELRLIKKRKKAYVIAHQATRIALNESLAHCLSIKTLSGENSTCH